MGAIFLVQLKDPKSNQELRMRAIHKTQTSAGGELWLILRFKAASKIVIRICGFNGGGIWRQLNQ